MIIKFKIFENEITDNNTTGRVGDTINLKDGYFKSGNDGDFGTTFTHKGEPKNKSYKNRKSKDKKFIKNRKNK